MLDQRARVWLDQRDGHWVITGEEVTARELVSTRTPAFDVATEAAGVGDVHDIDGSPPFRLLGDMGTSSGLAVGDVDCDGFEDVALLSSSRLRIYRNGLDGTFADVTRGDGHAGAARHRRHRPGVLRRRQRRRSRSLGQRHPRPALLPQRRLPRPSATPPRPPASAPSVWASMPIVADYDRDGFLDVFVVRMGDHEHTSPLPNWNAHNGTPDSLYRNNGDGTFSEVGEAAGVDDTGWGLAGAWGDYDDDGWPDLYVGNEFGIGALYHNERRRHVSRGRRRGRRARAQRRHGRRLGRLRQRRAPRSLSVEHVRELALGAVPPRVAGADAVVPALGAARRGSTPVIDELSRGGTLLRNNGDGTFTDVSDAAGIRDAQWGWGAEFVDYNDDGRLDIYNSNGMITGPLLDDV